MCQLCDTIMLHLENIHIKSISHAFPIPREKQDTSSSNAYSNYIPVSHSVAYVSRYLYTTHLLRFHSALSGLILCRPLVHRPTITEIWLWSYLQISGLRIQADDRNTRRLRGRSSVQSDTEKRKRGVANTTRRQRGRSPNGNSEKAPAKDYTNWKQ